MPRPEEPVKPIHDEEKFAIYLHTLFCTKNHADYCAWHYEHKWTDWTHSDWVKKARNVREAFGTLFHRR